MGAGLILGAILYHSPLWIQVTPLIITPVVWVYFTMMAFKNRRS